LRPQPAEAGEGWGVLQCRAAQLRDIITFFWLGQSSTTPTLRFLCPPFFVGAGGVRNTELQVNRTSWSLGCLGTPHMEKKWGPDFATRLAAQAVVSRSRNPQVPVPGDSSQAADTSPALLSVPGSRCAQARGLCLATCSSGARSRSEVTRLAAARTLASWLISPAPRARTPSDSLRRDPGKLGRDIRWR
jgi:hypothetical protein